MAEWGAYGTANVAEGAPIFPGLKENPPLALKRNFKG
jgi:hypothetical protein